MSKKTIISHTIQVGIFTLLSRVFGFIRQMLMARYLMPGITSDAFITAFRIPNSLRKIFAEGALSAALIPTLVHTVKKEGVNAASRLVTLTFVIVEVILLLMCMAIWWHADAVITFAVPGFSPEQHAPTVPLLKVLIAYIMFVSSSAVLAGGLQAVNRFFVPASSQIVLNIIIIGTLLICLKYNLPVIYLAYGIIASGVVQILMHLVAYYYAGLYALLPTATTLKEFALVITKFFPCLITMSVMEINLLIDGQFASYLQSGSITFISYASDFMRIPLGVFAVAFSTILLPHFSRVSVESPKRLPFYLLESIKMIIWVTLPAAIIMAFFSYDIFYTTYYSKNFTLADVQQVSTLLHGFLFGLIFFSLNKILVNVYYAFHSTLIPTFISVAGTLVNIILNYCLMSYFAAYGLVMATSISAAVQTLLFLLVLHYYFKINLYVERLYDFFLRYLFQLVIVFSLFHLLYYGILRLISSCVPRYSFLLMHTFLAWLWVMPLCACALAVLYFSRKFFGVKVHFLK